MVIEQLVIEKVPFTEIAPWMWENFSLSIIARISKFNMIFELFNMIESLLSNEDQSAFQTNLAERFLMLRLQVSA